MWLSLKKYFKLEEKCSSVHENFKESEWIENCEMK